MNVVLNNQQMAMARRIVGNSGYNGTGSILSAFRGSVNKKHDFNRDFGYPETSELTFEFFYEMWKRNGFARGMVEKTRNKTWQTNPTLTMTSTDRIKQTPYERRLTRHFDRIRLWQALAETDMRSMVGKYSGVILQLGDGRPYHQPVNRVPGGVDGIISATPCWERQLEPSEWDRDPMSPNYGKPSMYRFNESVVDSENGKVRTFMVHPDRCIIWSADGTTWGDSKLEPCYNALMDVEKIRGAGGEGYWKNSKAQPVLQADPEVDFAQLATMLGVEIDGIADALDNVIERWVKGFDQSLMLQGMEAKTIGIDIQEPKSFFDICMQEIAASWPMPQKILVGMQTGERASTEDAREWAQINMSRRSNLVVPNIMEMVRRFVSWGIIIDRDWQLEWDDLTAPTLDEKLAIGERMSRINGLVSPTGSVAFSNDEIRELAGYEAMENPIPSGPALEPDEEPDEEPPGSEEDVNDAAEDE